MFQQNKEMRSAKRFGTPWHRIGKLPRLYGMVIQYFNSIINVEAI